MKKITIYIFTALVLGTSAMGCCEGQKFLADLAFGLSTLAEEGGVLDLADGTVAQVFDISSEVLNIDFLDCDDDTQETSVASDVATSFFYRTTNGSFEQSEEVYDATTEASLSTNGEVLRSVGTIAPGKSETFTGYSLAIEFAGEYRINQMADALEVVEEENELNNEDVVFGRLASSQEGVGSSTIYIDASIEKYPFLKEWTGEGTPPIKLIVRQ